MAVQGTWLGIPDFGLTEALFGKSSGKSSWINNPNVYSSFGSTPQSYASTLATNKQYNQYQSGSGFNPIGPTVERGVDLRYASPVPNTNSNPTPSPQQNNNGSGGIPGIPNRDWSNPSNWGFEMDGHWFQTPQDYLNWKNSQQGGSSDLERQQREMQAKIRGNIENTYGNIVGRLDKLAGLYPQWQQEDVGSLQNAYNTSAQGISNELNAQKQKLGTYRQDIQKNKKLGLQEISQNLRNLMKATGMQLGAMGAGASSASQVIMPYALGKQASRSSAQVIKGANDQFADLDRKMIDVQSTYDQEKNQLDQWLNDSKSSIVQRYRDMKTAIDNAKNQADEKKMVALNALDASLLQNVQNRVNQLDALHQQYAMQVDQWAKNRIAQLQDYKLQLAKTANFSPQELTYEALRGLEGFPPYSQREAWSNPFLLKKKKRENQF